MNGVYITCIYLFQSQKRLEPLDPFPTHSAVWIKVAQVYLLEMRSGVKMGSPPGFLCHTE